MFSEFISQHLTLAAVLIAVFALVVGKLEERFAGSPGTVCITWFSGLVVALGGIIHFEALGVLRWAISGSLFVGGIAFLVSYYKKHQRKIPRW